MASMCRRVASASRVCRLSRRPYATRFSQQPASASGGCRSVTSSPPKIRGRRLSPCEPDASVAGEGQIGGKGDRRPWWCPPRIGRRAALGLGVSVVLAPRFVWAQREPARERPKEGDLLVNITATANPEPLKPDDLSLGDKQTFAWPMDPDTKTVRNGSRLNKVLMLRLDPEGFDAETKEI